MAKRVCPVCEDVPALKAVTEISLGPRREELVSWTCPHYPTYAFVSQRKVERATHAVAGAFGLECPEITVTLLGEPVVEIRPKIETPEVTPLLAKRARHWSVDRLGEEAKGLVELLRTEPRTENCHHITSFHEKYVHEGGDGTYTWTIEGYNALETASTSLVLKACGDSDPGIEALPVAAFDNFSDGEELPVELIRDEPFCKVFRVWFSRPVAQYEKFSVTVSCQWKAAFPPGRVSDYVFSPWGEYMRHGIDRMSGELVCDRPLQHVSLWRLDESRIDEKENISVGRMEDGRWSIAWEVPEPQSLQLISFEKG